MSIITLSNQELVLLRAIAKGSTLVQAARFLRRKPATLQPVLGDLVAKQLLCRADDGQPATPTRAGLYVLRGVERQELLEFGARRRWAADGRPAPLAIWFARRLNGQRHCARCRDWHGTSYACESRAAAA